MRLLTLNIRHGGGPRVPKILAFLADQSADVLVLTEYRTGPRGDELCTGLRQLGYTHQLAGSDDPTLNSVLLASRLPLLPLEPAINLAPHAHRILPVRVAHFTLVGVYFPQKEAKRPVFDLLLRAVIPALGEHGLILGDFNSGMPFEDEIGNTFSCIDRFDALLGEGGLVDAWRTRHPEQCEYSWYSNSGNGFRVDNALLTPTLNHRVEGVVYVHASREAGISDHSALRIDLSTP